MLNDLRGFVLDGVAKAWASDIDLYDDELIEQHTQMRSPGVIDLEVIRAAKGGFQVGLV